MVDLLIRKRGGWDDWGKNRLGMGGWGSGYDDNNEEIPPDDDLGCVIYILIYVIKGLEGLEGLFWLKFIHRSLLAL